MVLMAASSVISALIAVVTLAIFPRINVLAFHVACINDSLSVIILSSGLRIPLQLLWFFCNAIESRVVMKIQFNDFLVHSDWHKMTS